MPAFLDITTTTSMLLLAAAGENPCAQNKPTAININPTTKDIAYDYNQDLAAIQNVKVDTVNPYGLHSATMTQGFMKGAIKVAPSVKLGYQVAPRMGTACLWYEDITVNIEIDPTIVVAKEVAADSCMGKAVLEHELKHIDADRMLVNKYARIIGEKIQGTLGRIGYRVGPVPAAQAEQTAKEMQEDLFALVESEYRVMEKERMMEQSKIDSLDEYERVSALCPDFKKQQSKK